MNHIYIASPFAVDENVEVVGSRTYFEKLYGFGQLPFFVIIIFDRIHVVNISLSELVTGEKCWRS